MTICSPETNREAEESTIVSTTLAHRISDLHEDIALGRIRRNERVPLSVHIDNVAYPICYNSSTIYSTPLHTS